THHHLARTRSSIHSHASRPSRSTSTSNSHSRSAMSTDSETEKLSNFEPISMPTADNLLADFDDPLNVDQWSQSSGSGSIWSSSAGFDSSQMSDLLDTGNFASEEATAPVTSSEPYYA